MIRKIIKIGNSEGVTIPVSTIKAYGLSVGKRIEVLIGNPGGEIYYLELLRDMEEFQKRSQKKPKTSARTLAG
ncbi:MAG: hypothetical protein AAB896_02745 [Patescibacteria group bacterium]